MRGDRVGAGVAAAVTGSIGLAAACFPHLWLGVFTTDAAVLATGTTYLRIVGPTYGFFGLGLALYFASQGAGQLLWPLLAGGLRLLVAVGGGWLAMRWFPGQMPVLFAAIALALLLFGITIAVAIQSGAWKDRARL